MAVWLTAPSNRLLWGFSLLRKKKRRREKWSLSSAVRWDLETLDCTLTVMPLTRLDSSHAWMLVGSVPCCVPPPHCSPLSWRVYSITHARCCGLLTQRQRCRTLRHRATNMGCKHHVWMAPLCQSKVTDNKPGCRLDRLLSTGRRGLR